MLNKSYLDALGIHNSSDGYTMLKEAYYRAHDIRKFEIEMYWRRSAYIWTLQAAALAGLAAIFATSGSISWGCLEKAATKPSECQTEKLRLIAVVAVWAFGLISSIVWVLLLRGAKSWQDNWERHLDYLEDYISGRLYKTHLTEDLKAPYSVSKLNLAMAIFMMLLWLMVGSISASIVLDVCWPIILLTVASLLFFFFWLLDDDLRMSNFGKKFSDEKTSRGHWIMRR